MNKIELKNKYIYNNSEIIMNELLSIKNNNYKTWTEKFPNHKVKIFDLPLNIKWKTKFFKNVQDNVDCNKIDHELSKLLEKTSGEISIFPNPDLLFSSFNHTDYDNIKVIIIGQDPYFNSYMIKGKEIPEAMGLSFSVPIGIPIPSSLRNIFKNALDYNHFYKSPEHGNLEFWTYQGCLLLNSALTVQKGCKNSHCKIWNDFTNYIIKKLSDDKKDLVFVLWGGPALSKLKYIDTNKHQILISSHPSGLSNHKNLGKYPSFSSIDQFGTINKMLKKNNKKEIIWQI